MKDSPPNGHEQMITLRASEIEQFVDTDDDYARAMRDALARMEKGFHLGGTHRLDRDALHDRNAFRDSDPH